MYNQTADADVRLISTAFVLSVLLLMKKNDLLTHLLNDVILYCGLLVTRYVQKANKLVQNY